MFDLRVRFVDAVSCRISYRELSQEPTNNEDRPAWLDFLFQGGSNVFLQTPWYPVSSSGSTMKVEGHFEQSKFIPSSTNKPFIDAGALEASPML